VTRRVESLFASLQVGGAGVAKFFPTARGAAGDPRGFQWFVEPHGNLPSRIQRGNVITDPNQLIRYFSKRRQADEQRILLMVAFESVGTRFVGLSVYYQRTATDLHDAPTNAHGVTLAKATYDCQARRFPVWAAGVPAKDPGIFQHLESNLPCDRPAHWIPARTIVGCGKAPARG
jgi:hypothetical protein